MKLKIFLLCFLLISAGCASKPQTNQTVAKGPIYEITNITGNLYRARSDNHYTVFLVTNKGTILADPLNLQFAQWLKQQLTERFNSTVRYVLYSHHHWDHASGGGAFVDTARFIGHENMIAALEAPLPANYAIADTNGDGFLQRDEAGGGAANRFDILDQNNDNKISGAELNVDIIKPDSTYTDTYSVYLDNQEVQMIYAGENHSNDATILNFGEEASAFGVDWLNVKGLPRTFYGTSLDSWIASTDKIIALNVTRVVPGHGQIGNNDDMIAYRQYFIDLRDAARAAITSGMSQDEFQSSISLDAYKDWTNYDNNLSSNAAEAYQMSSR